MLRYINYKSYKVEKVVLFLVIKVEFLIKFLFFKVLIKSENVFVF